jgi:hypothetical protein
MDQVIGTTAVHESPLVQEFLQNETSNRKGTLYIIESVINIFHDSCAWVRAFLPMKRVDLKSIYLSAVGILGKLTKEFYPIFHSQ